MTFKPEEKIVATTETPRGLIERLLTQQEPTFRLFWEPGTRLWRMHKLPDRSSGHHQCLPAGPTGLTTNSEIANALGIHRNTLIISQDFAAYRNMLRTVEDMQQFTKVRAGRIARPNGAAVGDDE